MNKSAVVVTSYEFSSASTLNIKAGDYILYTPDLETYSVAGCDNGTGTEVGVVDSSTQCDCTSCNGEVTCTIDVDGNKICPNCCECSFLCNDVCNQTLSTI